MNAVYSGQVFEWLRLRGWVVGVGSPLLLLICVLLVGLLVFFLFVVNLCIIKSCVHFCIVSLSLFPLILFSDFLKNR